MGGTPLTHIAVQNRSTKVDDITVMYWVSAVGKQVRDHLCKHWPIKPPAVVFYSKDLKVTPRKGLAFVNLVDEDGDDGAVGYHLDLAGYPFGYVDMSNAPIPSRTLSHEILEMCINPHMDLFYPYMPHKDAVGEICDPVKPHSYEIVTNIQGLGPNKSVTVSNFVTPHWFEKGNSLGPYDYMTKLASPFELAKEGGYLVTSDGQTTRGADIPTNPHSRVIALSRKLGPK